MSIGVPSFNGGPFVREALESLTTQDYSNIEVLISDDGSSDDTAEICAEFGRIDDRIVFDGHKHLGERRNFNRVLALARGEYFMWAADHDLWHPRYVSSCVDALRAHPGAVLAYAHSALIDGQANPLELMDDALDITQERPLDRYTRLIWRLYICNAIYGVMRTDALQSTRGYGRMPGPDHLVLAKMALMGTFIQLPEVMYFRRQNRPSETDAEQRRRQLWDLDPTTARRWTTAPDGSYYRKLRDEHVRAVLTSTIPPLHKLQAAAATFACFDARFGVRSRSLRIALRLFRLVPHCVRVRVVGTVRTAPVSMPRDDRRSTKVPPRSLG